MRDHEAVCLAKDCHSPGCTVTWYQKTLWWGNGASAMLQLLDTTHLSGAATFHRPDTMRPGQEKGIGRAVAWPVLLHTLGRPRNGSHLLLVPDFVTGLVAFAMRIPYRCGFRPTGPLWRIAIELPTLLGWTRRKLRLILESNDRRQGPTGVCSSRSATIEMVTIGTIKADWMQLPVERYLPALPTLRQGVIAGVFRNKGGAAPWAITGAALGLSSQWFVIGWLVCRGLRPANCVAWRVYVGWGLASIRSQSEKSGFYEQI